MDTSKLSRNDWIVVAGMALMFFAMLLARLDVAAVVAWLLTLLAAATVTIKAVPARNWSCLSRWGQRHWPWEPRRSSSCCSATLPASSSESSPRSSWCFGGFLGNAETS